MKTLVVVAHPNLEKSVINRRWAEELRKYPEEITVHDLCRAYPDGRIDIKKEQALIEAHGTLLLQFPVYWFSCPWQLKKWMDEVLAFGWAFGPQPGADKMKGRKVALAVSAGVKESEFENGRSMSELLSPFEAMCTFLEADYRSFFAFYGAEDTPSQQRLEKSAVEYSEFARSI